MTKRVTVRAAGAVVLRGSGKDTEVLLIHRARYDDWSLPKGKGETDELAPQTAVREVLEETGMLVCLGLRLPTAHYVVSQGRKAVKYWRARVLDPRAGKPDGEADKVSWVKAVKALNRLDYPGDQAALEVALDQPPTTSLLVVRHAKAMLRKNWSGPDQERRLTGRGRRQAKELAAVMSAFAVSRLVSSSSTRCVHTLRPYSEATGIPVKTSKVLTEEEGAVHPREVQRFIRRLVDDLDEPTAVCGHRPVLPAMFDGLGLTPRPMVVAETIVAHLTRKGKPVTVEVHKPTG